MKKLGFNTLSVWFGLVMIIMVIAGAIAFAFTDFMIDRLYGIKRMFFIAMLLVYAVYRIFRLYQAFQQSKYNED